MRKRLKEEEWLVFRLQHSNCCLSCKHLLNGDCPKKLDYETVKRWGIKYPIWRIGSACESWC